MLSVGRSIEMLLVGDRITMKNEGHRAYGTVSAINENSYGEMTYWIDGDDGENWLVVDDSDLSVLHPNYELDFN
jgi:hypothetical protein